jgi:hypothetical protein
MVFPENAQPQSDAGVGVQVRFFWANRDQSGVESLDDQDWGRFFSSCRFKGTMNGGYIVKLTLVDPEFAMLPRLIRLSYFQQVRKKPVIMAFRIFRQPGVNNGRGSLETDNRQKSTREQHAILFDMSVIGSGSTVSRVEFVGVDPASWYLNVGEASGEAITGNVGQAIEKTLERYTANSGLRYKVTKTRDAKTNKWYLMRQDPKTFISSLLEWSASLTPQQTHWLISMDGKPDGGPHIAIQEQAEYESKQRGYYSYNGIGPSFISTIKDWSIINNNALSVAEAKLVTQGVAMTSGIYFDRTTDKDQRFVYVTEQTTKNKRVARAKEWMSTSKPPSGVNAGFPDIGITSIASIPEVYSALDIGLNYNEYIDGRARSIWLNMLNSLMRMQVRVLGHGEWYHTFGLGVDTVLLNWTKEPTKSEPDPFYFAAGNWLVTGFEHHVTRKQWYTDLMVARWDYDSDAVFVPQDETIPGL